ncbi:MAG TPA: hypothetical protein DD706_01345 [Nitrospiraceae bacterium]|nr:hypothetical protein [Nitrospiraceae bacterium]
MSLEAFISFTIFLFLSLIALAIRWLNERIRRDIALRDLKDLFLPSGDSREQQDRAASDTTKTSQSKPKQPIQKFRPTTTPKRRTASRPRLRNKADLRQGIIIMTVLGPCRALEHPDD